MATPQRMTTRQREVIEWLTWETAHLVSHYLTEGGTPFDFQTIYYRTTDRFDYGSANATSLRRTLRTMEAKGLLIRGSTLSDVAGQDHPECVRRVATWHLPETFARDCKLLEALPFIVGIKRQEVTEKTPKKHIKPLFGSLKTVDSAWLEKPLIAWLDGKAANIVLPAWVKTPFGLQA